MVSQLRKFPNMVGFRYIFRKSRIGPILFQNAVAAPKEELSAGVSHKNYN